MEAVRITKSSQSKRQSQNGKLNTNSSNNNNNNNVSLAKVNITTNIHNKSQLQSYKNRQLSEQYSKNFLPPQLSLGPESYTFNTNPQSTLASVGSDNHPFKNSEKNQKLFSPHEYIHYSSKVNTTKENYIKGLQQLGFESALYLQEKPLNTIYQKTDKIMGKSYSSKYIGIKDNNLGILSIRKKIEELAPIQVKQAQTNLRTEKARIQSANRQKQRLMQQQKNLTEVGQQNGDQSEYLLNQMQSQQEEDNIKETPQPDKYDNYLVSNYSLPKQLKTIRIKRNPEFQSHRMKLDEWHSRQNQAITEHKSNQEFVNQKQNLENSQQKSIQKRSNLNSAVKSKNQKTEISNNSNYQNQNQPIIKNDTHTSPFPQSPQTNLGSIPQGFQSVNNNNKYNANANDNVKNQDGINENLKQQQQQQKQSQKQNQDNNSSIKKLQNTESEELNSYQNNQNQNIQNQILGKNASQMQKNNQYQQNMQKINENKNAQNYQNPQIQQLQKKQQEIQNQQQEQQQQQINSQREEQFQQQQQNVILSSYQPKPLKVKKNRNIIQNRRQVKNFEESNDGVCYAFIDKPQAEVISYSRLLNNLQVQQQQQQQQFQQQNQLQQQFENQQQFNNNNFQSNKQFYNENINNNNNLQKVQYVSAIPTHGLIQDHQNTNLLEIFQKIEDHGKPWEKQRFNQQHNFRLEQQMQLNYEDNGQYYIDDQQQQQQLYQNQDQNQVQYGNLEQYYANQQQQQQQQEMMQQQQQQQN